MASPNDAAALRADREHIVIFGGSGFLGSELRRRLVARGIRVTVVGRQHSTDHAGWSNQYWDVETMGPWAASLADADVIVHMSGKRVDCRPNRKNINALIESRSGAVELVGKALSRQEHRPRAWIQVSSLAIFGDGGDTVIDEKTQPPTDGPRQMVEVCRRWEEAFEVAAAGIDRRVLLRPGIAIGGVGDPATRQLKRLAKLGLGGRIGSGRQWVSWIAAADLFDLIERAVLDETMSGLYHLTSPEPVTNTEMMAAYRAATGRRFGLPSTAWMTRIGARLFNSDSKLALLGRRCIPARLSAERYQFGCADISEAVNTAVNTKEERRAPQPERHQHASVGAMMMGDPTLRRRARRLRELPRQLPDDSGSGKPRG